LSSDSTFFFISRSVIVITPFRFECSRSFPVREDRQIR
jgi:hypothetical protein